MVVVVWWIFYCISISEMLVTHISSAVYFEQSDPVLGRTRPNHLSSQYNSSFGGETSIEQSPLSTLRPNILYLSPLTNICINITN